MCSTKNGLQYLLQVSSRSSSHLPYWRQCVTGIQLRTTQIFWGIVGLPQAMPQMPLLPQGGYGDFSFQPRLLPGKLTSYVAWSYLISWPLQLLALWHNLPWPLVGKVVCCDILKFNHTDTDTDMSWHVFFLATLTNFSCRWTVGVNDIKNENNTKKYII